MEDITPLAAEAQLSFIGIQRIEINQQGDILLEWNQRNFIINANVFPRGQNLNNVILGADQACYGDQQFRLQILKDNRIGLQFTDENGQGATAQHGKSYYGNMESCDSNNYYYQATSQDPLINEQWNDLKIEKIADNIKLTLNGQSRSVQLNGNPVIKPIVPFRVNGRFCQGKNDERFQAFNGKIGLVTIQFLS